MEALLKILLMPFILIRSMPWLFIWLFVSIFWNPAIYLAIMSLIIYVIVYLAFKDLTK